MPQDPNACNREALLPDWYQLYFAAVMEADESKALVQIGLACRAIEDRLSELRNISPDNPHELRDLNCAFTYLRLLLQNIDTGGAASASRWNWPSTSASR